jgi:hypothetical protein
MNNTQNIQLSILALIVVIIIYLCCTKNMESFDTSGSDSPTNTCDGMIDVHMNKCKELKTIATLATENLINANVDATREFTAFIASNGKNENDKKKIENDLTTKSITLVTAAINAASKAIILTTMTAKSVQQPSDEASTIVDVATIEAADADVMLSDAEIAFPISLTVVAMKLATTAVASATANAVLSKYIKDNLYK